MESFHLSLIFLATTAATATATTITTTTITTTIVTTRIACFFRFNFCWKFGSLV